MYFVCKMTKEEKLMMNNKGSSCGRGDDKLGPRGLEAAAVAVCLVMLVSATAVMAAGSPPGGDAIVLEVRTENGVTTSRLVGADEMDQVRALPRRALVKFRPGRAPEVLPGSGRARTFPGDDRLIAVEPPPGWTVAQTVRRYRANPNVEFAEPDAVAQVSLTPTDPRWSEQWGMLKISAPEGWETAHTSTDVVVAVLDTGIDFTHPDLQGNLWTDPGTGAHGFTAMDGVLAPGGEDDHGHGTHVAGIIGAVANNGIGVAGMTWQVQLLSMKFLGSGGTGDVSDAILCFDKLVELSQQGFNVRLANCSWSFGLYSQALLEAIQRAEAAGVLSVCAAGNRYNNIDVEPAYPASYPGGGIVSVLATDQDDASPIFSSYGLASVDLAAPGEEILSTVPTGTCAMCDPSGYRLGSGTSMSTPHVVGALAAVFQINPLLTPAEARDLLLDPGSLDSLIDIPSRASWSTTGGRLNLAKVVTSPLLAGLQLNQPPVQTAFPFLLRSAGSDLSLAASSFDPEGDPLRKGWGRPGGIGLLAYMLNLVFPGGSSELADPYSFQTPHFVRTTTFSFGASVNDGRGGSDVAESQVTVLPTQSPGQPPTGQLEVTPLEGPVGTEVSVTYTVTDPEGGDTRWAVRGFGWSCCYYSGKTVTEAALEPGAYRVSAQAIDSELNLSSGSESVVVRIGGAEGEPPVADLALDTIEGEVPLTVSYDASGSYDPDGVSVQYFLLCDQHVGIVGVPAVPPFGTCVYDEPGIHSIDLLVVDESGYVDSRIVDIVAYPPPPSDLVAPTVTLTAPAAGATLAGSATLSAEAQDDVGVVRVDLLVDDIELLSQGVDAPYQCSWDTSTVTTGSHVLLARAWDAAGNESTDSVTVNVADQTAPEIALYNPRPDSTANNDLIYLTAVTSDDVGVVMVEYMFDGEVMATSSSPPSFIRSIIDGSVGPGEHVVTGRAWDEAGNSTVSDPVLLTVVDVVPPEVTLTWPSPDVESVSGPVVLTAEAWDPATVVRVDFLCSSELLGSDTTEPYSLAWDSTGQPARICRFAAQAVDGVGNVGLSDAVTKIVLDIVPPDVAIAQPSDGATVENAVVIEVSASDNDRVSTVELRVDGEHLGSETSPPFTFDWETRLVALGSHEIKITALDPSGNTSEATSEITLADTTPPAVTFTSHQDGDSVEGTVLLAVDVIEYRRTMRVSIFVDDFKLCEHQTAPYACSLPTSSFSLGSHDITAKAVDQEGNEGVAAIQLILTDTTPPEVTLTSPEPGASIGGAVQLAASMTDDRDAERVEFLVDDVVVGSRALYPYFVTWDSQTVAVGSHQIRARGYDEVGNAGMSAPVAVTVLDTTAPDMAVTSPVAGASVSGTFQVVATASDNLGVTQVDLLLDGTLLGTDTTEPYTVDWSTQDTPPGAHSLTARGWDAAGNSGLSVPVQVTVLDETPPTVSITGPPDGSEVDRRSTVSLSAVASDLGGISYVQFLVDGTVQCTDGASPYVCNWTVGSRKDVTYTIEAIARDTSGNTTSADPVTVTSR